MNDDAAEIRARLEDQIEGVLDALAPGWVRHGPKAYLTPKSPKDLGSFQVGLGGDGRLPRGAWYRHSQGIGGGSVEIVSYLLTDNTKSYKQAFEWARTFLGIDRRAAADPNSQLERERRAREWAERRQAEQAEHAAVLAAKKEERAASAQQVWDQGLLLEGSHGDSYFVERGLPPVARWGWDCRDTLRFHPHLDYELDRSMGRLPAVIGKVQDTFGDLTAVWQIYLDPVKPIKATIGNAKVGRGPAAGGAVRIGGDAEVIGVAEGLESALGAFAISRFKKPCWSTLSTSGMVAFEPPLFVKKVVIWPDGDRGLISKQSGDIMDPPGIAAARKLAQRMREAKIPCTINDTCRDGDALDMWNTMKRFEDKEIN